MSPSSDATPEKLQSIVRLTHTLVGDFSPYAWKDKKSDVGADRLLGASSSTTTTTTTATSVSIANATSTTKVPTTTTALTSSTANPTPPSRINLSDLTVTDDLECKFTLGNFKMLYVVNSESYLYKHSSLLKAKKVSGGKRIMSLFFSERGKLISKHGMDIITSNARK